MLSYREFMKQVRNKMDAYSEEELRKIIENWASEQSPSNRNRFLDKFNIDKKIVPARYDYKKLISEVEQFAHKIEDGYYFEGYG